MNKEMAMYVADYCNEEINRGEGVITAAMILSAIEAFEGGAR